MCVLLDRAWADAEPVGDLFLGQVEVVAEHDDLPLSARQREHRVDQRVCGVVGDARDLGRRGLAGLRQGMGALGGPSPEPGRTSGPASPATGGEPTARLWKAFAALTLPRAAVSRASSSVSVTTRPRCSTVRISAVGGAAGPRRRSRPGTGTTRLAGRPCRSGRWAARSTRSTASAR